ncbi:hypothetical protein [Bradyrhizobium cajani]|uniref:Glycosyltransferase RgtA/B/C/D-like domain-containing protein n=1 Tax=Bradyrhizobium cajani TaxID=1928661 RepID=A0A844T4J8_9BRAD|nr:hypothetical protein [Bradyrhizobium cajani]MCP3371509.1 hypothetical protein [Bradyrhizobium cajani]MVT74043.1 hypothetical protein [Bradyrhizobium cajani]
MAFGLICLLILASNVRVTSHWTEARGVWDDICYLRQAHLFQLYGIGGLDTDVSRDEDHFLKGKLKEIGFPEESPAPCHPPNASGKYVMQYPPGTGLVLALFPQGHQVVPLYVSVNLIVCGFALLAIFYARSIWSALGAGVFGALAVYMMINPAKASYSIAPTMALCAVVGYLTALWLIRAKHNVWLLLLIGLLLGLSVNLRLPNLFLVAGYVLFLGVAFLRSRTVTTFVQGLVFGLAFIVGMIPTLVANAINAGSPFVTTYSSDDAKALDIDLAVLTQYLHDMQFALILLAVGSTVWLLRTGQGGARQVAFVVGGNLLVNLIFFVGHPTFTPYYVVPITMLSAWSVCFALVMQPAEPATQARLGQKLHV